ncbi:MAG: hypothetical protein Q9170_005053 [Blastenia crenularia]
MKDNFQAHYDAFFIPIYDAIISYDTRSPSYHVQSLNNFALKPADVTNRIPPLNRQSDMMWTMWKTLAPNPNSLRYICRTGISNDDTKAIMNEIFSRGPAKRPVGWPGLTFRFDTEEAQALFGTPNGLATAYLLMDRAKELGRRELTVTIAATGNEGFRMLWDMAPYSMMGVPIPGPSLGLTFIPGSFTPGPTSSLKTTSTSSR